MPRGTPRAAVPGKSARPRKSPPHAPTTPAATSAVVTAETSSAPAAPGTSEPATSAATDPPGPIPEWRLISVSAGRGRKGQRVALLVAIYWTASWTASKEPKQRARVREWFHAPFDGPDSRLSPSGRSIPTSRLLGRPAADNRCLLAAKRAYEVEVNAQAIKARLAAEREARAATRAEFPPRPAAAAAPT